jgi:restriction system protein
MADHPDLPTYQGFMRPLLELLRDQKRPIRAREAYEQLADRLGLDESARAQMLPSGKQHTYKNRIGWASTYLRFAGLVHSPSRGNWQITEAGAAFLAGHAGPVDLEVLEALPAYRAARAEMTTGGSTEPEGSTTPTAETPEEQMFAAHRRIVASVGEELTKILAKVDPGFFEQLVVDLLGRMGYGTTDESRTRVGRSGDGGIDGIISLDRLGLEKVYVQAKKWSADNKVGRPDVQAFFGALAGQRATKGLFITTSSFTREAEQYAGSVSGSLVLVDGRRLVQLMIEFGLGVSTQDTLTVPKLDLDYFDS